MGGANTSDTAVSENNMLVCMENMGCNIRIGSTERGTEGTLCANGVVRKGLNGDDLLPNWRNFATQLENKNSPVG